MTHRLPSDAYEAYAGDDEVEEARAVAGPEPPAETVTTYSIHRRNGVIETAHWEVAEVWSSVGAKVTATTGADR